MGKTQITQQEDLVRFPDLAEAAGSLTWMEKSLLGHLILLTHPRIIIELGVFEAVTTQFIYEFMEINNIEAKVIGFDLPKIIENLRNSNAMVQHWEETSTLQLVPGRLPMSLKQWLNDSDEAIDFVLVDAAHDYRSVIGELSLLWPRLSADGYILCHDYSNKWDGVRYAVDRFAAKHGAMVLPLTSSEFASQTGHASVLVALCRRPYKNTLSRLTHHLWQSIKVDLLRRPMVNKLWSAVRPLVRRRAR